MPLAIGDDELWVGPRFESGEGCFECLGFRFYHQSPVVHYAYLQSDCHLSIHRASWRQLLTAAELLREEADAKEQRLTLVKRTGETTEREHHFLRPWPHCPICMGEQPVEEGVPVRLQSRPKIGYTDGGDRTEEAQATIRRLIDRVDPFTSEVGRLTPVITPEEGYGYSMVISQWATLRNADRLWNGAVDWKKGRIQSLGVNGQPERTDALGIGCALSGGGGLATGFGGADAITERGYRGPGGSLVAHGATSESGLSLPRLDTADAPTRRLHRPIDR